MSRLYVGRLPRDVRERDIERLFKGYGQIRDICLLSGFGFVEFRERRDAEDVMHDFNNREFMGERLLIEPARVDRRRERSDRGGFGGPPGGGYDNGPGFGGGPGRRDDRGDDRGRRMGSASAPQRTPYRMLVENLSSSVSWQDLKDFARRAGEVSFADAHKLRPGEGIVEFIDESGLRTALRKLDGEDLRGRRVVLREDSASRGGYGGGGGGGSGGRPPRDRSFSPRRAGPRDRSFSPRRQERSRSRSGSPGFRRPSYRSRSPAGRRMSPGRRPASRSRSPLPARSRSPMDAQGHAPPPHQPMGRSSMSPRSPDMAMAGEPEPELHAENGADMGGWE